MNRIVEFFLYKVMYMVYKHYRKNEPEIAGFSAFLLMNVIFIIIISPILFPSIGYFSSLLKINTTEYFTNKFFLFCITTFILFITFIYFKLNYKLFQNKIIEYDKSLTSNDLKLIRNKLLLSCMLSIILLIVMIVLSPLSQV
ncbi:MAG: hypothetical protein EAZ53_17165 [Bacteroidetes bacterium]|nr:MAG: hypothetical protein EAZ53_17165 [Bacteroidota bacterium]